jgi:hypothetical protein
MDDAQYDSTAKVGEFDIGMAGGVDVLLGMASNFSRSRWLMSMV